jgi:hypothetical protein
MRKKLSNLVIYGGVGTATFFGLAAAEQVITERVLGDFDAQSWKGAAGSAGAILVAFLLRKVVQSRKK